MPDAQVLLSGRASDDGRPWGAALTLSWSVVNGPGDVVFRDVSSASTTATFATPGVYVLRLTASDGELSASDEVQVTVIAADQAPNVDAGPDATLLLPDTAVLLNGTVSDDGLPAGSVLTVSWSVVSGPGDVVFGDASSASTTATLATPGVYGLRLTASDGELSAFDDTTVTLGDPETDIVLKAYSDGWGTLLRTYVLQDEGDILISIDDPMPYYDPPRYYLYAFRKGYFTELYRCEKGDTIHVAFDPVTPGGLTGVIFITQAFFAPVALVSSLVTVTNEGNAVGTFQTDEKGRFAVELSPGPYTFAFRPVFPFEESYEVPVVLEEGYHDILIPANVQLVKPNIYLYPPVQTQLEVTLTFPNGGRVTEAIPEYGNGWQVQVDPAGQIDGQYSYLFYESQQPDLCQYETGWVVAQGDLARFFRDTMADSGFNDTETTDFITYWMPRLNQYPYYAIYPQYEEELDPMVTLHFSVPPDSLLRVVYAIRGIDEPNVNLAEPAILQFSRHGFAVVEWGVTLRD